MATLPNIPGAILRYEIYRENFLADWRYERVSPEEFHESTDPDYNKRITYEVVDKQQFLDAIAKE